MTRPRPRAVIGSRCSEAPSPELGDLVLLLLAGSLAGLRDRLFDDGFEAAGEVVDDLAEILDQHLTNVLRVP